MIVSIFVLKVFAVPLWKSNNHREHMVFQPMNMGWGGGLAQMLCLLSNRHLMLSEESSEVIYEDQGLTARKTHATRNCFILLPTIWQAE